MTDVIAPSLPLPPPLKGTDPGSFAEHTVSVRMPAIARRVLAENEFRPEVAGRLETLIAEMPDSQIRPLALTNAPDAAVWRACLVPYEGKNWLQVPWFFAETYFYRRIVEATGFFSPGPDRGRDPYAYQKRLGMEEARSSTRTLAGQLADWVKQGWDQQVFGRLLHIDLWGNQVDLSIWPAGEEGQPKHADAEKQRDHILVDDTDGVTRLLNAAASAERVGFMVDNAGFELVCDLALADYLLSSHAVAAVCCHLKIHPTFVSDATIIDMQETVEALARDEDAAVRDFAGRLKGHLGSGRLQLLHHPFWTSCLAGWQMPADLRDELAASILVISKGDANYRRLLGDRHWPYNTPFADILSYFPAPLVALRALKSEVAAGLQPGQAATVAEKDLDWMTNGRWGLIQLADGDEERGNRRHGELRY